MQMRSAFYSIALLAVCGALAPAVAQQAAGNGPAVQPSYMDRAVKPGDDFYQYACGTWHKNAAMPADRAEVTPGMDLDEAHTARLHQLILDTVKNSGPAGSGARKLPTSTTPTWTRLPLRRAAPSRLRRTSQPLPPSRTSVSWRAPWARHCAPMKTR